MRLVITLGLSALFLLYQNCSPLTSSSVSGSSSASLESSPEISPEPVDEPIGELPVEPVTPDIVPKLTNNNAKSITWPYTFTWESKGFELGSKADIWINGVDQGAAKPVSDELWTINSGPTGEVTVELIEVFSDLTFVVHDTQTFTVTETTPVPSPVGNLIQEIELPEKFEAIVNRSLWNQITNDAHVFLTGDPNKLSIVNDEGSWWMRASHPAGQVADLTEASGIPSAKTTTVDFKIKFAPNWEHGQGNLDSGKLGWGLAGGSTANNIIVSGGSTETTGWSIRWGFDGEYLILYAYYSNRPGMNYPNTPPKSLIGQFIKTDVVIVPGKSYSLSMTVTTNDVGKANGSFIARVNGIEKANIQGMYYMSGAPETKRLFFASNHGGNASNLGWAPTVDTWVQYKDISVHR